MTDAGDQNIHPTNVQRCTETIDLFGAGSRSANARRSDPVTSHAAAASIPTQKIRESQSAILSCFKLLGPRHDTLLVSCYEAQRVEQQWPKQSPSGIRTRRKELVSAGFLEDSGERQRLDSGRMSIVWQVAQ